jgi:hypothetical protein
MSSRYDRSEVKKFAGWCFRLRLTPLVALFIALSIVSKPAYAYTDICAGPTTVTTVSTLIQVPPGTEFDKFVSYLRKFALERQYVVEPSTGTSEISTGGLIDLVLLKKSTSEAIHISNRNRAEEIEASMSECGGEGFKPYWNEFMAFVKKYAASRPNYPL